GAKQYGGLMLDGNSAGSLFGIFAVPVYLLLASFGYRRLGIAILLMTVPTLLLSLSRSGIVGFLVGLIAMALIERRRLRGLRVLAGLAVFAALWALTAGSGYVAQLEESVSRPKGLNRASSGRQAIWSQVLEFLHGRWTFGGGLDSFQKFALNGPLQHAFATHNMLLRL